MTAFRFHTDAAGHVCGGHVVDHGLSSESWSLAHIPIRTLEEGGVEIAWPNGERWEHAHCVGSMEPQEPRA